MRRYIEFLGRNQEQLCGSDSYAPFDNRLTNWNAIREAQLKIMRQREKAVADSKYIMPKAYFLRITLGIKGNPTTRNILIS